VCSEENDLKNEQDFSVTNTLLFFPPLSKFGGNTAKRICKHKNAFLKLKLIYGRKSVGQSVLVSGTHLGPVTNFSLSLKFSLDSCGFVIL
jgi:hypothetical protein